MPAINLGSPASPAANPSTGVFVIMNPFSGPTGSPFDNDQAGNLSTGALNTGIGFGSPPIIGPTAPQSIKDAGFNDNYVPGVTLPGLTDATDARLTCIGGGRSGVTNNGEAPTTPYNAQPILAFGNGASRDAGAGPAFTGFAMKTVTATATVANGAVVETGFTNRSGVPITNGQSVFGSNIAASAAVA